MIYTEEDRPFNDRRSFFVGYGNAVGFLLNNEDFKDTLIQKKDLICSICKKGFTSLD